MTDELTLDERAQAKLERLAKYVDEYWGMDFLAIIEAQHNEGDGEGIVMDWRTDYRETFTEADIRTILALISLARAHLEARESGEGLAETLRDTTEEMANRCSVDQFLWQRHSRAALDAADALAAMKAEKDEAVKREREKWQRVCRDTEESYAKQNERLRAALEEIDAQTGLQDPETALSSLENISNEGRTALRKDTDHD